MGIEASFGRSVPDGNREGDPGVSLPVAPSLTDVVAEHAALDRVAELVRRHLPVEKDERISVADGHRADREPVEDGVHPLGPDQGAPSDLAVLPLLDGERPDAAQEEQHRRAGGQRCQLLGRLGPGLLALERQAQHGHVSVGREAVHGVGDAVEGDRQTEMEDVGGHLRREGRVAAQEILERGLVGEGEAIAVEDPASRLGDRVDLGCSGQLENALEADPLVADAFLRSLVRLCDVGHRVEVATADGPSGVRHVHRTVRALVVVEPDQDPATGVVGVMRVMGVLKELHQGAVLVVADGLFNEVLEAPE